MKVKEPLKISNKKKNALPSSKLIKPKKFKPMKKANDSLNPPLSKDKLKLISIKADSLSDDNSEVLVHLKSSNKSKTRKNHHQTSETSVGENTILCPITSNKSKGFLKESKTKRISTLFDFDSIDQKEKANDGSRPTESPWPNGNHKSSLQVTKDLTKNNESGRLKSHAKRSKTKIEISSNSNKKVKSRSSGKKNVVKNNGAKTSSKHGQIIKVDEDQIKHFDMTAFDKCTLKANKVAAVTKGLLKLINDTSSSKPEILDVGEPVFLQIECIKIPICPTKQLRMKLPHPLVDETSDVLLITSDLKGHKIFPDKAVEHYEELFAKHEINFINKVMPLRMIKKEYSQYEMKRKLVDQFDVILADCRIVKSLASVLGSFALYKHKMPIPVHLTFGENKLKNHLKNAICKTQMTVKSNGHCSVVQIGHTKMSAKEIAGNILEVAKLLETAFPGGWRNIRSLVVKTATSTSLPVYLSLLSPNEVKIPVEVRRRPKPVEGELSTMPGFNVLVTADGNVILKKVEEDLKIDDSRDDEILEEAEKYMESSKTVRYDESSDEEKNEEKDGSDSDGEGEAITEAMEKKLMNKYEKNAKAKKNKRENEKEDDDDDDEEEEEEEHESEEESEVVPLSGKKRKSKGDRKQSGPPAKKATKKTFTPVESKGKTKADKSEKDNKNASPGFKKQQMRGSRGGKKNKLSKDQRKALIKRKKAGKK